MKKWVLLCGLLSACTPQNQTENQVVTPTRIEKNTLQVTNAFYGSDVQDKNMGIDFSLPSTLGKNISLQDTAGKITILVFGYTHCPDVCPTNLLTYADALKQLGEDANQVQLYFVTVDPKRDTIDVMQSYVTTFHPSFVGLVAQDEASLESVKKAWSITAYPVPIAGSEDYSVDHSTGTYLLDRTGKTIVYEPHGASVQNIVEDLQLLLAQEK